MMQKDIFGQTFKQTQLELSESLVDSIVQFRKGLARAKEKAKGLGKEGIKSS